MPETINPPWTAGQKAALGRTRLVTIDRVTPIGRAIVGNTIYEPDGRERGRNRDAWHSPRLEHLTPDILEEVRRHKLGTRATRVTARAEKWARGAFSGHRHASNADVEKAERLIAAILSVLPDDGP